MSENHVEMWEKNTRCNGCQNPISTAGEGVKAEADGAGLFQAGWLGTQGKQRGEYSMWGESTAA